MERAIEKGRNIPAYSNEEEFTSEIKIRLEEYFGNRYEIRVSEMRMNNNVRKSYLRISSEGVGISTNIFLAPLFADYIGGKSILEICWDIIDKCGHEKSTDDGDPKIAEVVNSVLCFEMIKDSICYKLINADMNREVLNSYPHRFILDLAVVYFILVSGDRTNNKSISIDITNKIMTLWGIDEESLYRCAEKNTTALLGTTACPAKDFLERYSGRELDSSFIPEIWMVSNSAKNIGAAAMLNKELMEEMAEKIGSDYYILPSSIHEILLYAVSDDDGKERSRMGSIVRAVNISDVEKEEILSDHAYRYCRDTGKIEIVG